MALLPAIFPLAKDSTDKFESTIKLRYPVLPEHAGQIFWEEDA
jgi:hypothetical protein